MTPRTPRTPRHSKDTNSTPNIGGALEDTLRRFGIAGYILGIEADGDEISVDVVPLDEDNLPLFHPEEEAVASVRWTASIRDGAGRRNLK